jgi:hypothetical protein
MSIIISVKRLAKKNWLEVIDMKQIKLSKSELERLIKYYSSCRPTSVDKLVETCKDLDKTSNDDLRLIYNAFCKYLRANELCIYPMRRFHLLTFVDNIKFKRLTENVDLDDVYFALNLSGFVGYQSFNDLHSFLQYRIPLNLNQINNMLEFTFEDDEEGEEGEEHE